MLGEVDIDRNSIRRIAMIKRISVPTVRSQDLSLASDTIGEPAGSAIAEKARDAITACRSGGLSWVIARPGTSLILALCGGVTLGWLVKRR